MFVWRICSKRHESSAFSGEGSKFTGARWNSKGVPLAYAAENLSLAALELFVNVSKEEQPEDLIAIQARVPLPDLLSESARDTAVSALAADWRYDRRVSQAFGDQWVRAKSSLVLCVPSVVIEEEWNVLLNPEHPEAARIEIVRSRPFRFDERMFRHLDKKR